MNPGCATSERCSNCAARFGLPFCDLPAEALEAIDSVTREVAFERGATLFRESDIAAGVYIVCSGQVKLVATSSEGRTIITQIVEQGEALGLSAVVSGRPLLVTAEAIDPVVAKFINRLDFLRILETNGALCLRVAQHISRSYHCANTLIRTIGLSGNVHERLARLLIQRCEKDGIRVAGGVRLRFAMTHEEIAQMIGSSRETVTRAFGDLRRQELVERRGRNLLVRDMEALSGLAGDA